MVSLLRLRDDDATMMSIPQRLCIDGASCSTEDEDGRLASSRRTSIRRAASEQNWRNEANAGRRRAEGSGERKEAAKSVKSRHSAVFFFSMTNFTLRIFAKEIFVLYFKSVVYVSARICILSLLGRVPSSSYIVSVVQPYFYSISPSPLGSNRLT